jgi:hypothetical protein
VFLVRLLEPSALSEEARANLQAIFLPRGLLFVRLLLAGIVGALPPPRIQDIADVLFAIVRVRSHFYVHGNVGSASMRWLADAALLLAVCPVGNVTAGQAVDS